MADDNFTRDDAELLWEEYKYRHQHIWNLIFQITIAVVAVSIIPYILKESTEEKIGHFIISLPIIGLVLTIISTLRVKEECNVLYYITSERSIGSFTNQSIRFHTTKGLHLLNMLFYTLLL